MRDRENIRDAGGVVGCAIVNGIALRIRRTDAEVIPMRAVHDVFVAKLWIAATSNADDVLRLQSLDAVVEVRVDIDAGRNRFEVASLCLLPEVRQIESSLREKRCRRIVRDPASDCNWRRELWIA